MPDGQQDKHSPPFPSSKPDNGEYSDYNFIADKIGFVPNVRKSDNKLQAKIFAAAWLISIFVGLIWAGTDGAFLGALFGIVIALVVSGAVMTIVGLRRKS